jgi:hypothetical protein
MSPALKPFSSLSVMSGAPAAASRVGIQSRCETMPLATDPALMWPGQRTIAGTR